MRCASQPSDLVGQEGSHQVVGQVPEGGSRVEVDVTEASIGKVVVGAPCEITLDALPEVRLLGEVSRIVPTVDRAKATVLVKVAFVERDPRTLPDMSAKAAFLKQRPPEADRKPVAAVRKVCYR